jgi:hypothetical protein
LSIASNSSVEPNFGTPGQYSIDAYPPATLSANMVYSGEDTLTLTVGSFVTELLENTTVVMQVWSYNTSSGLWAFLFGQQDGALVAPYYRSFQQSDVDNLPGSREQFAKSVTRGNSWIVRGWDGNGNAPVDTFVYTVNRCQTDLNPCHANADCTDVLGYAECTCQGEYIGDGFECVAPTPSTPPITIPVAPPRAPVTAPPTSPPRAPTPTSQPVTPPIAIPIVETPLDDPESPSSAGNVTDIPSTPSNDILPSELIPAIVVPAVVLIAGIILLVVLLKRKKKKVKKYDNKEDKKQQLEPVNTVREKKLDLTKVLLTIFHI